jgi:hypothetical protein
MNRAIQKAVWFPSRVCVLSALIAVILLPPFSLLALADALPSVNTEKRDDDESFARDNSQEKIAGAVTLVGLGFQGSMGAPSQLALMEIGEKRGLWLLGTGDRALPLVPTFLAKIRDHRALANGLDPKTDDAAELSAFVDALVKANLSPIDAIANGARRDVSRTNLLSEPHRFRGEVIHVEGKLRLVEKLPAPLMVSYLGIHDLYEAWIFEPGYGANPSCLLLTELPEGLTPGSHDDVPVSFDGYFFKIYRYKSRDRSKGKEEREAPLFIGRTLTLLKGQPQLPSEESKSPLGLSSSILAVFLGFIICSFLLAIGLTFWFRRSDSQVRERLRAGYKRDFIPPDFSLETNKFDFNNPDRNSQDLDESSWERNKNSPGVN